MPTKSALSPSVSAVEHFADQAAAGAESAIQSTKKVANDALDSLQSGVNDLRHSGPTALTRAAAQVEEMTRRGIERAREATHQVKDQVVHVGDKSVGYIRDEPVKAVLIAAAAGAAIAVLISLIASSASRGSRG